MLLPAIQGVIQRRILANYRINPDCCAAVLPSPFRPQLAGDWAIGGICLIRLDGIRPKRCPLPWGIASENAAHRIAVEWEEHGETMSGVYIPRRDTSSRLNVWAGGTVFPGIHHHSRFRVVEDGACLTVTMDGQDGKAKVHVSGGIENQLSRDSVFSTLHQASDFFRQGSVGYSNAAKERSFDGLELRCKNWQVTGFRVDQIQSSFFDNTDRFPTGSIEFDSALFMRGIRHEWHGRKSLCCSPMN